MLLERSSSIMKMKRQTNNNECTSSRSRSNPKWSLVLATIAGVALALGCSSDRHARADYSSHTTYTTSTEPTPPPVPPPVPAPPPAAGAAETPSGQSSGYATTTTTTTTTSERTDVITDPAMLPSDNIGVAYAGRSVNFTHMRGYRVFNDRFLEVTSDDA